MYFKKSELEYLLFSLKKHNKKLKMIVTISRQSLLNNIGNDKQQDSQQNLDDL